MIFDVEDVICLTNVNVPNFVKFIISLGKKFAYVPDGIMKLGLEFDFFLKDVQLHARDGGQLQLMKARMPQIVKESLKKSLKKSAVFPQAMYSIKLWLGKAKKFLHDNKTLLVTEADKGGKLVIIEKSMYMEKLKSHIKENIDNGTYGRPEKGHGLVEIRGELEGKHKVLRDQMNPILRADGWKEMCFEPFIMAKLVLAIKVHKEGYPTRPIVTAADRWNKSLSKWLLRLLTIIANKFSHIKVKNSEQFSDRLLDFHELPNGHKLSTYDYNAMFTNVPYYVPREVVADSFYLVKDKTSATLQDVLYVLDFIVESSSFFICDGEVYKQEKGLTMGNELSQVLADIATNKATIMVLASIKAQRISFVYKYIDDFATAMDEEATVLFQNRMGKAIDGLKLVATPEDGNNEIVYLDMAIKRNYDNSLTYRWQQKGCAKGSILNFFSNHPLNMKRSIVNEYIRHALKVTSPQMYGITIRRLERVLRKSSYPWSMIRSAVCNVLSEVGSTHLLSVYGLPDIAVDCDYEIYSRMRGDESRCFMETQTGTKRMKKDIDYIGTRKRFIAAPFYSQKSFNAMKQCINASGLDVALAPSPVMTNGTEKIFSNMKMDNQCNTRKFAVFSVHCVTCGLHFDIATGNTDLGRFMERMETASERIVTQNLGYATMLNGFTIATTPALEHLVKNQGHFLNFETGNAVYLRTAERMYAALEARIKARRLKDDA